MQNIKIDRSTVNIEALNAELQTALGSSFLGMSTSNQTVIVHLTDAATVAMVNQARQIVINHNPATLTPAQQAEVERQQKLEQARRDFKGVELDLNAFNGKDTLLVALARKIAWLEREIAALRGSA